MGILFNPDRPLYSDEIGTPKGGSNVTVFSARGGAKGCERGDAKDAEEGDGAEHVGGLGNERGSRRGAEVFRVILMREQHSIRRKGGRGFVGDQRRGP